MRARTYYFAGVRFLDCRVVEDTQPSRNTASSPDRRRHLCHGLVALFLLAAFVVLPESRAAGTSVAISLSPETVALIREWRAAHGLPVDAEAKAPTMVADSRGAVAKALRLAGVDGLPPDQVRVAATHERRHWRVNIHVEDANQPDDYVVEVADAVAAAYRPEGAR
jgi:hypothetical protein